MTRLSRPVAIRAAATFAAVTAAFLALADAGEARMLRDDCFTEIIAACNQSRDVDAAHWCVVHETNSCQQVETRPAREQRVGLPRATHLRILDTLYSAGENAGGPGAQGAAEQAGNGQGGQSRR